jgi:hypothetical protein
VTGGVRRLVNPKPRLLRLVQVVAEHVADVDLTRSEPGQARRRIRDSPDDELLEGRRLAPVVGDRLEAMVVALLALHVAERPGADRVQRGFVLSHRLDVLLRGDVLVADELGEVRGHFPDPILEVHHHRVLIRGLDAIEMGAKERRRPALRVGLEILLDGELDVLGGHLAEALVELHARAQLESPRPELVRGLPFGGEPRTILEGLGIAHDQRIVDAVPQGLLGLAGAPRERRLDAPLSHGDDQPLAGGDGA